MHLTRPVPYCRNLPASIIVVAAFLALGACDARDDGPYSAAEACTPDSFLTTRLYGAIAITLDWQSDTLTCEGMPRPAGEGARIRLSGPINDAADANTVAFILGLPDLQRGRTAREIATNVTFMEEGTGRFFGTADTSGCWTDVDFHDPLEAGNGSAYRIGGTVYCVSALAELNGGASISFTELTFSARLNWDQPE